MNIEGTHLFDAPQEAVWRMLLDPAVLAKIMPNCQALDKTGEGEYEGKMKIQVGPVQGVFQGKVVLSNLQAPSSYHMHIQGKGPAGVVDGEGDVRLADDGGKTVMVYSGEAKVSGRIASIGQRLMETSARAIIKQSLENLEQQVLASQRAPDSSPEPEQEVSSGQAPLPDQEASPKVDEGAAERPTASAASPTAFASRTPAAANSAAATDSASGATYVPDPPASSTFQFAIRIAREMFDEFVPADKQKWVFVAIGLLLVNLYLNWGANRIARRVARLLE